jgi:hypothetical protein
VLPKYLNSNWLAIASVVSPPHAIDNASEHELPASTTLQLTLLNTASGGVLAQVLLPGANGPVHMVASENWLLASYWNSKSYRNELTILEMFEPVLQWNVYESIACLTCTSSLARCFFLDWRPLTQYLVDLEHRSRRLNPCNHSFCSKPTSCRPEFAQSALLRQSRASVQKP